MLGRDRQAEEAMLVQNGNVYHELVMSVNRRTEKEIGPPFHTELDLAHPTGSRHEDITEWCGSGLFPSLLTSTGHPHNIWAICKPQ